MKDTYNTINTFVEGIIHKEKNSKFIGYAFPLLSDEAVSGHLETLKKRHKGAGHYCYAYILGTEEKSSRTNDDGEPINSAGKPILGQIESYGLTNTLVVVVRYFGGVKLGVGGLIQAYKNTAKLTLEACNINKETINTLLLLTFDYKSMSHVMRVIKEKKLEIINQKLELSCSVTIAVRKKYAQSTFILFDVMYGVNVIAHQ